MANVIVSINGKAYPCRSTMGAMLRFKQETGKDFTAIDLHAISDICTYFWCCVVSACKADGVDFDMTLMDFADVMTESDMNAWSKTVNGESSGDTGGEKKSK